MRHRRLLLRSIAASPLLAWSGGRSIAEEARVLVVADQGAVHRATASAVEVELARLGVPGDQVVSVPLQTGLPTGHPPAVQVAVGAGALRAVAARPGSPLVAVQVSRMQVEAMSWPGPGKAPEDLLAIVTDQPHARWMALADLVPVARRGVGVLLGPGGQGTQRSLERAAADRNLPFHWEHVGAESQIIAALERLLARVGLLLAIPDPLVHNRHTVQPILLTAYRAGCPLIGYSESYTNAGAVLSLHSSPDQLGRQAADGVLAALRGRPASGIVTPRQFRVSVNATVARSLGLQLPAAPEIEERLT